jgi:hypothetical protein
MNIIRFFETFRTCETVKNTKTVQNNGIFPYLLPNLIAQIRLIVNLRFSKRIQLILIG